MKFEVNEKKILKTLNKLDKTIRGAYSSWKGIITVHGFQGLRSVKGFHLEILKGKRKGQYSCRLNKGFRVYFKKTDDGIAIEVLEINKHDY